MCLFSFDYNYSALPLRSFPFLLLPSLPYIQMMMSSSAMFFNHEPAHMGYFECPVQETELTTAEIQELLSLLQAGNSVYTVDERKRRRTMLNRESARRSRLRKKRHLEDMTNEVERLKIENLEMKNRLGVVAQKCYVTWRENDHLTSESLSLCARLSDLYRILIAMQMQYSQ